MGSFWGGFLEGTAESFEKQAEKRATEAERQAELKRIEKKAIMDALLGGEIEPTTTPEEAVYTETLPPLKPRNIGQAIMQGIGLKRSEAGGQRMYRRTTMGSKEAITDESGNIIGYRPKGAVFQPKPTVEKPTLWDIQKEARTTVNAMINQNPVLQAQAFNNPALVTDLIDKEAERLNVKYKLKESLTPSPIVSPEPTEPTQPIQPTPPTGERIKVISPEGKRGTIPKSQLPEALREGYKQIS